MKTEAFDLQAAIADPSRLYHLRQPSLVPLEIVRMEKAHYHRCVVVLWQTAGGEQEIHYYTVDGRGHMGGNVALALRPKAITVYLNAWVEKGVVGGKVYRNEDEARAASTPECLDYICIAKPVVLNEP